MRNGTVSQSFTWYSEVVVVQGDTRNTLLNAVVQLERDLAGTPSLMLKDIAYSLNTDLRDGTQRLAVIASTLDELAQKLAYAATLLADPTRKHIKEISGIYFFEDQFEGHPKTAFLFPGEGSQYINMLADLCLYFPDVRAWFDFMDRAFIDHPRTYPLSQIVFPPPGTDLSGTGIKDLIWQMDYGTEAVFAANQALLNLLNQLGIAPDMVIGHSTGEYSALLASGVLQIEDEANLIDNIRALNEIYEHLQSNNQIPKGTLIAVAGVEREAVRDVVARSETPLYIATDNCPHQIALFGSDQSIAQAKARLKASGAIVTPLPFDRAYHTPLFGDFAAVMRSVFDRLDIRAPQIDLYSCMTASLYPQQPEAIRELAIAQWSNTVRFRDAIEAMYSAGARLFIESGPRGNLTAFVDDILRDKPHLAIPANVNRLSGVTQLQHLVGLLAAHGMPLQFDILYTRRDARRVKIGEATVTKPPVQTSVKLALELPTIKTDGLKVPAQPVSTAAPDHLNRSAQTSHSTDHADTQRAETPVQPLAPQPGSKGNGRTHPKTASPVMAEYLQTMDAFLSLQEQVMTAFLAQSPNHAGATIGVALTTTPQTPLPVAALTSAEPSLPTSPSMPAVAAETQTESDDLAQRVLSLVSERTGYPIEMLDPALNLEADLGIDSIKRMEIIGGLRQQTDRIQDKDIELLVGYRTLQEIINFLEGSKQPDAQVDAGPDVTAYPLIDSISQYIPEQELVAACRLSLDAHPFLLDHVIGGRVSAYVPDLYALPVMPLTMSLEMIAEAAACLFPDKHVVGISKIQAQRWIAFTAPEQALTLIARVNSATGGDVQVQIYHSDEHANDHVASPIIEGVVQMDRDYPRPDHIDALQFQDQRRANWDAQTAYKESMFHGPRFRGVRSLDVYGTDGASATLQALPADDLVRSTHQPQFIIDPVTLDAAGQVIGFWTAALLEQGFVVFPLKLDALQLFNHTLRMGETARCQARITLGDAFIQSDIDVISEDGKLAARLIGWQDKRFFVPKRVSQFILDPQQHVLSRVWNMPLQSLPQPEQAVCCMVDESWDDFMEADVSLWQQILAHVILNQRERATWLALQYPAKRKKLWLLGRLVAKDAVRLLIKKTHGIDLYPADIEIANDEHGQPLVRGEWLGDDADVPKLSLAHSEGTAAAMVEFGNAKLGIDIECTSHNHRDFAAVAFDEGERKLLAAAPDPTWSLRMWCAKEAVAKALGRGLAGGPRSLTIKDINPVDGIVRLVIAGELARLFPEFSEQSLSVYTARESQLIVATTILTRSNL